MTPSDLTLKAMTPIRIQRSRKHKQVSPNGLPIVYCGRGSKWGNPFRVVKCLDKWGVRISDATDQRQIDIFLEVCKGFYSTKEEAAKNAVKCYIKYSHPYEHGGTMQDLIISSAFVDEAIEALAGKNLSCWCKHGETCHVDWLLEITNKITFHHPGNGA